MVLGIESINWAVQSIILALTVIGSAIYLRTLKGWAVTTIAKAHQAAVRTAPRFALAWLLFLYILVLTLIVQRSSNTWVYYEGEERNG